MTGLTPNDERILGILNDGQRHSAEELLECLSDDLASRGAVKVAVCRLRAKLRRRGRDILCEFYNRRCFYRQVILITDDHGD